MVRAISYEYLYRVSFSVQSLRLLTVSTEDKNNKKRVPQIELQKKGPGSGLVVPGYTTLRPTRRSSLG